MPLRALTASALLVAAASPAAADTWPTHGWRTSTPEEQGIDPGALADMLDFTLDQGTSIHAVLVVRHGRLVLEAYGPQHGPETPCQVHDVANSVVSALVGIAVGDGRLRLDQTLGSLFPEHRLGPGMERVTIRHLLTMSSGVERVWSASPEEAADWPRALLERRTETPLGQFSFGEVNARLALAALARATGQPPAVFARERLFAPLGIERFELAGDGPGVSDNRHRLSILPRDMAKLGYLYLRHGEWAGRQIVPAAWIEASTRKQIDPAGQNTNIPMGGSGYGYLWWTDELGGYAAVGFPGQYIFVVPEKDLVVVFTSHSFYDFQLPRQLMRRFVLPAIRSDAALPRDPRGEKRLAAAIKALG
jgi:CubicO group peptidase (beta-lactamase class C family)